MGRDVEDIDYAVDEIIDRGYIFLEGSAQTGTVISHNIKTHKAEVHEFGNPYAGPYEDYGVLIWMDKNGNLKEKGKKHVRLGDEYYRPVDFIKIWEVPVEVGDYGIEVINFFHNSFKHPERTISLFQIEDIVAREGQDDRFELMLELDLQIDMLDDDSPTMSDEIDDDGTTWICRNVKDPLEKIIHQYVDEMFWEGIEKAIKIPKKLKGTKRILKQHYPHAL